MTRHRRLVAVATLAGQLSAAAGLMAQTTGSLELGASAVDYETFLGSAAVYLVPTIAFEKPGLSVGAQAHYVLFESGNQILQGTVAGGVLRRLGRRVRAEFSGSTGLAAYADAPIYGHVLGRGRVHVTGTRAGAWASGATGQSFLGAESNATYEVALGLWAVASRWMLSATATGTWLGDTAYLDVVGRARWAGDFLEFEGTAGVRGPTRGVASGAYGELTLRVPLSRHVAVTASGGSYPADPARGSIAASYASLGLRLTTSAAHRPLSPAIQEVLARALGDPPPSTGAGATQLTAAAAPDGRRRLRVAAPGARTVEIMGDFTDWEPVPLRRLDRATFEVVLPIAPGAHRVNVRVDGGPWLAPGGTRVETNEFGGAVGVLVISER